MKSAFTYQNKQLHCESVALSTIAKKVGTPSYVYSSEFLKARVSELQKGLKNLDSVICFAMKANSNLSVIKLLASQGCGVDIVSGGELFRASKAKIPARHIVFSGVGKTRQEMQQALLYSGGIFSFNVESEHELQVLSEVATQLKKTARVALRFNPDVDAKTHPYISTGLKKNKFGMTRSQVIEIVKSLHLYPGIALKGLSIHIGSQLTQLSPIEDAFNKLQLLLKELIALLPNELEFIDLGGGLGVDYQGEKVPTIASYCRLIESSFGPKTQWRGLKILIEPGRVIAANSGVLLTQVLYRKPKSDKDFLVVDAGMNDLLRPALYQSKHSIQPLMKAQPGSLRPTDIVGPVCESADCFISGSQMSAGLKAGDLLAIGSAGAYGFSMASTYNSRPKAAEVLVTGKTYKIIGRRETYEDLIQRE